MLFSNPEIVDYINESFEPVWESLRPVPTVVIDFHNGHVIRRSLQGNIATYVCAPDGLVLDILPGMYSAEEYLDKLKEFQALGQIGVLPQEERRVALARYHNDRLATVEKKLALAGARSNTSGANRPANRPATAIPRFDVSKMASQAPLKELLSPGSQPNIPAGLQNLSSRETSQWEALLDDTVANETVRRNEIHRKLVTREFRPNQIVKWLYKEILHADLDDPYLGLEHVLFGNYPFKST